jgi:hypothetical protein
LAKNKCVALIRTCRRCGGDFLLHYVYGRPREYCFDCVPEGYRLVKPPGNIRLRRVEPKNASKGN